MTDILRYTEDAVLSRLYENFDVRDRNVVLPLTDFVPALSFEDCATQARLMVEQVPSWEGVKAICGLADRSAGCIIQIMSQLTGVPYTLANWYPPGSKGKVFVQEAQGFSGPGVILFNGIEKDDKVIFADIVIRGGTVALSLVEALVKNGIVVTHAVFGADFSDRDGLRSLTTATGVPATSVGTVVVDDNHTIKTQFKRNMLISRIKGAASGAPGCQKILPAADVAPSRPLQLQPRSMVNASFQRVLNMFSGIPVYFAENSTYPYSNFSLTDFDPLMDCVRVEDIADCMCYLSPRLRPLTKSTGPTGPVDDYLIVSESDRGGGPLAVALSRRTGLKFTMANWSASVQDTGGSSSTAQVGYSGHGSLYLNSVGKGTKVIVIDDMLSSGGTCAGLLEAIERAGGIPVECIFASEKTTTKGRQNLAKKWPDLPLISVCYFSSSPTGTIAVPPTAAGEHHKAGNETPIQSYAEAAGDAGSRRARA